MSRAVLAGGACAAAMLAAWAPAQVQAQPPADAAGRCERLGAVAGAALGEPTARITEARLNPASATRPAAGPNGPGAPTALPEHCEVLGILRERTGTDGKRYAVKFRVRLPTAWNGRFLFEGGGGTVGVLGETAGRLQPGVPNGLTQGFAVVSTDTGHDNATNSNPARQGTAAFGHDYEARLEHAETSLDTVATAGKRLTEAFYGRPAHHSYFAGCSNGGREGMVFAQRFPAQFDGVLATAPAFAVPKAALASTWEVQTYAALAAAQGRFRRDGRPDLPAALSDADLKLAADAAAAACDAADGRRDGMVQDVLACTTARVRPELAARTCQGAKTDQCLAPAQVDALVRAFGGPRDGRGRPLYSDWRWDVGVSAGGWRVWKLGMPGGWPINVTLLGPALSALFVSPPDTVAGSPEATFAYQQAFDFDRDALRVFATTAAFPRSAWDLENARTPDLDRFRARGGKMIVPHGGSDPIFSIADTVDWWQALNRRAGGTAAGFVRVFPVPGMVHCQGGPATDQYDALSALVAWVEQGRAPARIEARAGPEKPWPGRARPLCPWPTVARYRSGDPERSESFACVKGRG